MGNLRRHPTRSQRFAKRILVVRRISELLKPERDSEEPQRERWGGGLRLEQRVGDGEPKGPEVET